jgi:phosphopantetheine adenylyltransferase
MKRFDANLETVFLPADPILSCVSSTYVRELLKYHCPIGDAMPAAAAELAVRFRG